MRADTRATVASGSAHRNDPSATPFSMIVSNPAHHLADPRLTLRERPRVDPDPPALGRAGRTVGPQRPAQLVGRVGAGGGGLVEPGEVALNGVREGLRDQRVLGAEVVEDQRRADVQRLGDVGDPGGLETDPVDGLGGRLEDLVTPQLDAAPTAWPTGGPALSH